MSWSKSLLNRKAVMINTDNTIVINWFDQRSLSEVVGEEISKKEFEEFKEWLEDSELASDGSDLIREYYYEWKGSRKSSQKQSFLHKKAGITEDDLFDRGIVIGSKVLYWHGEESVEAVVEDIITDYRGNVNKIYLHISKKDADYLGIDEEQEIDVSPKDTIGDIIGDAPFQIMPIR